MIWVYGTGECGEMWEDRLLRVWQWDDRAYEPFGRGAHTAANAAHWTGAATEANTDVKYAGEERGAGIEVSGSWSGAKGLLGWRDAVA